MLKLLTPDTSCSRIHVRQTYHLNNNCEGKGILLKYKYLSSCYKKNRQIVGLLIYCHETMAMLMKLPLSLSPSPSLQFISSPPYCCWKSLENSTFLAISCKELCVNPYCPHQNLIQRTIECCISTQKPL